MKLYSPKYKIISINMDIEGFFKKRRLFNHRRFRIFYKKGISCVHCGITANAVVKWHRVNQIDDGIHYDLFYLGKNKKNTLFTIDHIIPKSKGGKNNIENLQPMCYDCNNKKDDKIIKYEIIN